MTGLVGALEIGGTHVSACRVIVARARLDKSSLRRFALDAAGAREELVATITRAARDVALPDLDRWGVATPGPFDYEHGIARIRGVAKLDSLYGVDLRERLARHLGLTHPERVRFLNDAHAFVLGEWWAGAARGYVRVMGVTLGTGLGSGFLVNGELVLAGNDVPPEARLDLVPFRGAAVEDVISRRGLLAQYRRAGGEAPDVADIAQRARNGDHAAIAAFRAFGAALGEFLTPWIQRFAPACLVFGGGIARAWPLFSDAFEAACVPAATIASLGVAARLDEAPLLGAARHAIADATITRSPREGIDGDANTRIPT